MKIKFAFLLLLLFFLSACTAHKIISHPLQQEIMVDGNHADWQQVDLLLNEQPPFMIGVSHSEDHIYLLIRSNDVTFTRRLRLFGFTLWLNDDKTMGLELPGRFRGARGAGPEPIAGKRRNKMSGSKQMALTGNDFFLKRVDKNERIPLSTLAGFSVASSIKDGVSTMEFGFPSNGKTADSYSINPQDGKITLGLEYKISPEDNQRRMARGGRGGIAGGRRGMSRRGAGNQPPPEGQRGLNSKTIWFHILLQDK